MPSIGTEVSRHDPGSGTSARIPPLYPAGAGDTPVGLLSCHRRRIDLAVDAIDYKNPELLKRFVTESGKILPRRLTGVPAHLHRRITRAIKRARSVLLLR